MLVEDYVREIRTRGIEDSYELLTSREREILQLLAEGKSNKEIATLLQSQPVHGGDAPPESAGQTEPPQPRRTDPVRRAQRSHFVGIGRSGDPMIW